MNSICIDFVLVVFISWFLLSAKVWLSAFHQPEEEASTRPHTTEPRTSSHTVSPRAVDGVVYLVLFQRPFSSHAFIYFVRDFVI